MAYAEPNDVAARLGRPLTTDETSQVTTLLEDAEILIRAKLPDLEDRITAGTLTESTVVMVEASAVARLVRNPDGYTAEGDGSYTYQINWRLASGELDITDREWSLLGASSGSFTIDTRPRTPFERARAAAEAAGVHPFYLGADLTDPHRGGIGWGYAG